MTLLCGQDDNLRENCAIKLKYFEKVSICYSSKTLWHHHIGEGLKGKSQTESPSLSLVSTLSIFPAFCFRV